MRRNLLNGVVMVAMSVALAACRQDMHDAPRYEPLEASAFFPSGGSAQTLVPNTVPRGYLREDELRDGPRGEESAEPLRKAHAPTLARHALGG